MSNQLVVILNDLKSKAAETGITQESTLRGGLHLKVFSSGNLLCSRENTQPSDTEIKVIVRTIGNYNFDLTREGNAALIEFIEVEQ